ncbi:MAG: XdhC family protein [Lysobacterales bacterium]
MTRHGLSALLSALNNLGDDTTAILATVIDTEGSSYRKAGARMLIELDDQQFTGIVGGGCFDDDLLEHAREVAQTRQCKVAYYDMRADDDVLWGLGMGCNGAVRVLLQPMSATHPLIGLLEQAKRNGGLISTRVSDGHSWLAEAKQAEGLSTNQDGDSVFTHTIAPQFRLGIFGTGSDVLPVVDLADQLDWQTVLWDHRPGKVKPHRFPLAFKVSEFDGSAPVDAKQCQAILVMSHNFDADRRFLNAISSLDIPFVGTLGPATRRMRLLEEIDRASAPLSKRIHGPVGLDLGGELPEDIALSVIAQIQAHRLQRSALPLPQ